MGKAKGMKKIQYERHMIDLDKILLYSIKGPKGDKESMITKKFSYFTLLANCTDFVNEKTLLQLRLEEVGQLFGINVTVDRTAKCHPETAGEGIEYTWACSKRYMRSIPLAKRRSIKTFTESVNLCLSTKDGAIITKEKVRHFSGRARDYNVAYLLLKKDEDQFTDNTTSLTKKDTEKTKKMYRSHRNIIDQENKTIKDMLADIE